MELECHLGYEMCTLSLAAEAVSGRSSPSRHDLLELALAALVQFLSFALACLVMALDGLVPSPSLDCEMTSTLHCQGCAEVSRWPRRRLFLLHVGACLYGSQLSKRRSFQRISGFSMSFQ